MKQLIFILTLIAGCTALSSGSEIVAFGDAMLGQPDAGPCPTGGRGALSVVIEIPKDLAGDVTVSETGSLRQLTRSDEIMLEAGEHRVLARRITVAGETIGRAYSAVDDDQRVCVRGGMRSEVRVTYELEPGSKKLWTVGGAATFHTASYAIDDLAKSGSPAPATTIAGAANRPSALAFDREGRLWITDVTGKVLGYARGVLGSNLSSSNPDVLLEGDTLCAKTMPCGPQALAFDANGDLWLALPDSVVRIEKSELSGLNQPEIATRITGKSINRPRSIAFDVSGALWVGNGGDSSVVKFEADRLTKDDSGVADRTLLGQVLGPVFSGLSSPTAMAFDVQGNLWVGYLAPNLVARYTLEDQEKEGPVTPALQLNVDAFAIVKGMAFDDAGNLWLTGQGKITRMASSQLVLGSDPSRDAVEITIEGFVEDIAFDPPAAETPLAR